MPKITGEMQWLLEAYQKDHTKPVPEGVEKIKLNQLVSKLGFFYEKFRNAIDYNEEHLVRRNSLGRLLRRQMLFLNEKDSSKIAQTLVYEFIRAQYLPNDTLPETVIEELAVVVKKYLTIFEYLKSREIYDSKKVADWFLGLAICELDEFLFPNERDLAITNFMYAEMVKDVKFVKMEIEEKEKNLQLYIATLKTYAKADPATLRYRLLKLYYPNWGSFDTKATMDFCEQLLVIKNKIEGHLKHPLAYQLTHIVKLQSVFFTILRETIIKNSEKIDSLFEEEAFLEESIRNVCQNNYQRIRSRLIGSIFRVIIYILFTKTILAFLLELPYDYFIAKEINWQALGINVVFHPILMFLVAVTIRVPGVKNTKIIIEEMKKIAFGQEREVIFKPKKAMKRGSLSYIVFNTLYLIMFGISFGIVIYFLNKIHFNILSGALFIFFLTIISFFGFRLRTIANQLSVIPRKDNLANFLVDFLTLPVVRVGRFFSSNFSKVNIFIYILDFIIETPFKMLVEFLEKAVSFIKEKREEIVE